MENDVPFADAAAARVGAAVLTERIRRLPPEPLPAASRISGAARRWRRSAADARW